jgi:hypothetical protein
MLAHKSADLRYWEAHTAALRAVRAPPTHPHRRADRRDGRAGKAQPYGVRDAACPISTG